MTIRMLPISASFLTLLTFLSTTLGQYPSTAFQGAGFAPVDGEIPSVETVAKRMSESFHSTPVLHVSILDEHMGVDYQCEGWMKGTLAMGKTFHDGHLVFAKFVDPERTRVQEFAPEVTFENKSTATSVLAEYDYDPAGGGWDHLISYDLSCGPGSIAMAGFLWHPKSAEGRVASLLQQNMSVSQCKETNLNNRRCLWYHLDDIDGLTSITWDLYVDRSTFEPVREYRRIANQGKVTKEDTYDYTFEHLPNDNGIHWGLEVDKLKAEAMGKSDEAAGKPAEAAGKTPDSDEAKKDGLAPKK